MPRAAISNNETQTDKAEINFLDSDNCWEAPPLDVRVLHLVDGPEIEQWACLSEIEMRHYSPHLDAKPSDEILERRRRYNLIDEVVQWNFKGSNAYDEGQEALAVVTQQARNLGHEDFALILRGLTQSWNIRRGQDRKQQIEDINRWLTEGQEQLWVNFITFGERKHCAVKLKGVSMPINNSDYRHKPELIVEGKDGQIGKLPMWSSAGLLYVEFAK